MLVMNFRSFGWVGPAVGLAWSVRLSAGSASRGRGGSRSGAGRRPVAVATRSALDGEDGPGTLGPGRRTARRASGGPAGWWSGIRALLQLGGQFEVNGGVEVVLGRVFGELGQHGPGARGLSGDPGEGAGDDHGASCGALDGSFCASGGADV